MGTTPGLSRCEARLYGITAAGRQHAKRLMQNVDVIAQTARLVVRKLRTDDAAFVLALLNDPDFLRFIGDRSVRTLADARDYILKVPMASYERHGFGHYLVELKTTAAPIGICSLVRREWLEDVDLGFALLPAFRRAGY